MTRRVAAAVLALGILAACGSEPALPKGLRIGDVVPDAVHRARSTNPTEPVPIDTLFGRKATVLYAWSARCPCIPVAEARIRKLVKRFGPHVAWLAVAGEPLDTVERVRETRLRLGSPYEILLDPDQVLCTLLGFTAACEVAVLDAERKLVYRGPLDEDYVNGRGEHLAQALTAVLFGKPVPVPIRPRTYGCVFNDPASCTQREKEEDA